MNRYQVWGLDVWGHSHASCADHGCPCMKGDDDSCECYFDINDRFKSGTIEVQDDEGPIERLMSDGYLADGADKLVEYEPDDDGEGGMVVRRDNGRPLLQLEELEGEESS